MHISRKPSRGPVQSVYDAPMSDPQNPPEVLASLVIAPVRWAFGMVIQYALAVIVLYLGFVAPSGFLFQAILIIIGLAFVFMAERGRRVRHISLELTRDGLTDSTGRVLATMDQIERVDRGALAFKPSNGFLLRLNTSPGRVWVPGLWWRLGPYVGVGGTTAAGAGKFMAEMIATLLSEQGRG